jgi:hypothetical protein
LNPQTLAVVGGFTNSVHCGAVVSALITMHLTAPKWHLLRFLGSVILLYVLEVRKTQMDAHNAISLIPTTKEAILQ